MDRLFVPLNKKSFEDFRRGKTFEVRAIHRHWNTKNVRTGRHVTLSCGYSGPRIEGTIGRIFTGTLGRVIGRIPLRHVEPRAKSREEAMRMNMDMLGTAVDYVAFEVRPAGRVVTRKKI